MKPAVIRSDLDFSFLKNYLFYVIIFIGLFIPATAFPKLQLYGDAQNWTGFAISNENEQIDPVIILENRLNANLEKSVSKGRLFLQTCLINDEVDNDTRIELKELYVDTYTKVVDLRFGKQYISWGIADGYFITDFSSLDLRRHLATELEDLRLADTGVSSKLYINDVTIEAITILIPQSSLLPDDDSIWAPSMSDKLPSNLTVDINSFDGTRYSDFGVRVSALLGVLDISLLYSYANNKEPYFEKRLNQNVIELSEQYKRFHSIGYYLTWPVSSLFLLKLESNYTFDYPFDNNLILSSSSDGLCNNLKDRLENIVVVEFNSHEKISLSFQYYTQNIIKYEANIEEEEFVHHISTMAEFEFTEYVRAKLFGIYNLTDNDSVLRTELSWSMSDSIRLTLGCQIYSGDSNTELGYFDDNDFAFFKIKYSL